VKLRPRLKFRHQDRKRHQRRMAQATERIAYGYEVKDASPIEGFNYIRYGIDALVLCGCDRELWPPSVQAAVPANTTP